MKQITRGTLKSLSCLSCHDKRILKMAQRQQVLKRTKLTCLISCLKLDCKSLNLSRYKTAELHVRSMQMQWETKLHHLGLWMLNQWESLLHFISSFEACFSIGHLFSVDSTLSSKICWERFLFLTCISKTLSSENCWGRFSYSMMIFKDPFERNLLRAFLLFYDDFQ